MVLNTGGMLFLGALFSGLEEEKELDTVFFEDCRRTALAFPEGQKQRERSEGEDWNVGPKFRKH